MCWNTGTFTRLPHSLILVLLIAISTSTIAQSSDKSDALKSNYRQAVSLDYLDGSENLKGLRISYRPYTTNLIDIPIVGKAKIYWETSVNFWKSQEGRSNDTSYAIALSPVFVKELTTIADKHPLSLEFGIGASYVHEEKFANRNIGSNYQFEDRLGFILGFGPQSQSKVFIRYMHYSNGGFNTRNPGLDFLSVGVSYHF